MKMKYIVTAIIFICGYLVLFLIAYFSIHKPILKECEKLMLENERLKTGKWIIETWNNKEHYTCSNCQHVVSYEPCYRYCPYCGANMIEPQESEGKE